VSRVFVAAVIALGMLSAVARAQAPDPELVAEGKALFASQICSKCHLAEEVGNKQFPLDGVASRLEAEEIRTWITAPADMIAKLEQKPVLPMPKVPLTDAQVDALVAYLRTLDSD
jgi:mono/diheme cytochrome c family protein